MIDLSLNPSIELDELLRVDDVAVIFEGQHIDTDGAIAWVYTVGGFLDGRPIVTHYRDHNGIATRGALVGGEAILVHAPNRGEADEMAISGLLHTISTQRERAAKLPPGERLNTGLETIFGGKRATLH